MRPKRYPFSGAKKESEAKKISLILKKVDESDLKGSVWADPLNLYGKTRVHVEIEGYGKKITTEFKTDDMDFSKKYQLRFQKKNGLEDLKKARKNLDWLIEEMDDEG